jgi:hypothetical protein
MPAHCRSIGHDFAILKPASIQKKNMFIMMNCCQFFSNVAISFNPIGGCFAPCSGTHWKFDFLSLFRYHELD